jgi:hypothetical protein
MALQKSADVSRFQIVCGICDGLGIVFDCREDAPASTLIKCRHCGAPRGTLGDLRLLSVQARRACSKFEAPTVLSVFHSTTRFAARLTRSASKNTTG